MNTRDIYYTLEDLNWVEDEDQQRERQLFEDYTACQGHEEYAPELYPDGTDE